MDNGDGCPDDLPSLANLPVFRNGNESGYDELTDMTDTRISSGLGSRHPYRSPNELAPAEDVLEQYLELIFAMAERIEADPEAYAEFLRLTAETRPATIQEIRDYLSANQ